MSELTKEQIENAMSAYRDSFNCEDGLIAAAPYLQYPAKPLAPPTIAEAEQAYRDWVSFYEGGAEAFLKTLRLFVGLRNEILKPKPKPKPKPSLAERVARKRFYGDWEASSKETKRAFIESVEDLIALIEAAKEEK